MRASRIFSEHAPDAELKALRSALASIERHHDQLLFLEWPDHSPLFNLLWREFVKGGAQIYREQ